MTNAWVKLQEKRTRYFEEKTRHIVFKVGPTDQWVSQTYIPVALGQLKKQMQSGVPNISFDIYDCPQTSCLSH